MYLFLFITKTFITFYNLIKRPLGRPRRRWEDNIEMDLQEVGGSYGDWIELAQDRDRWRALGGYGEEPSGSKNAGNFLTSCRTS
jgi:hypothetical protein